MATHQPGSKFHCDQCPCSYNTKGHLKQHQREHQGRFRPCPHCWATFAQKSSLVKHIPGAPSRKEESLTRNIPVRFVGGSMGGKENYPGI